MGFLLAVFVSLVTASPPRATPTPDLAALKRSIARVLLTPDLMRRLLLVKDRLAAGGEDVLPNFPFPSTGNEGEFRSPLARSALAAAGLSPRQYAEGLQAVIAYCNADSIMAKRASSANRAACRANSSLVRRLLA